MKKYIEVCLYDDPYCALVNVDNIETITETKAGTQITFSEGYIVVKETYAEVKRRIEEALKHDEG